MQSFAEMTILEITKYLIYQSTQISIHISLILNNAAGGGADITTNNSGKIIKMQTEKSELDPHFHSHTKQFK